MREWLNSEEGVETAIRLSNHIVKRYNGHNWYSSRSGRLLQPELLSMTYLSMDKVIDYYDPERGTIKTFLWATVPREVFRMVQKDLLNHVEYEEWMEETYDEPIDMKEIIQTLPQPRRDRFSMHLEGYTYKEIKEKHNISTSMVYKDINLAQQQLRKELLNE